MQLSLDFLDASAIEEVPVTLWREVFDALGWPASLEGKRETFTHADVAEAIRRDDLSDFLVHALEILHTLGTEKGREAIVGVMEERRVRLKTLPEGASERELAMHLYLGHRNDASLADVLARAQIEAQDGGDQCRYNEFLGAEPRRVNDVCKKREPLRDAVLRHCQEADLGDHVQVDVLEDDDIYVFTQECPFSFKMPIGTCAYRLCPGVR
jgi:hypothetical protein